MNNNNRDESSRVGYGRPPANTRFTRGQSGNPAGRQRGRNDREQVFEKVLRSPIKFRKNGRLISMPKAELIIRQAVNKAAAGDIRALEFLFKTLIKVMPPPVRKRRPCDPEEAATLLVKRLTSAVLRPHSREF